MTSCITTCPSHACERAHNGQRLSAAAHLDAHAQHVQAAGLQQHGGVEVHRQHRRAVGDERLLRLGQRPYFIVSVEQILQMNATKPRLPQQYDIRAVNACTDEVREPR